MLRFHLQDHESDCVYEIKTNIMNLKYVAPASQENTHHIQNITFY